MPLFRLCLLATLSVILGACAVTRPEPPEIQLEGLEVRELSLSHANFLAHLRLYNPNATSLDIEGVDFTLFLNDIRVARGKTAKAFKIPAEEFGETALHLSSSYLDLMRLTTGLQGRQQVGYRIAGEIKVGGFGLLSTTVPIEREGELPLTGSLQQLVPEPSGRLDRAPGLPGQDRLLRQ